MGYPLHADMQSAAWNPIVWLFALITHYSLAGFHAELLFYFIFSGIGFYQLCKSIGIHYRVAILVALAYQMSGFMLDSVQFFACISSACYIPWIFLYFYKVLKQKKLKHALALSIFLFLLFTGGYPAFFITTLYLLLAYYLYDILRVEDKKKVFLTGIKPLAISAIVFTILSLPAILSYIQHLPLLSRPGALPLSVALENSMNPSTTLSLLYPFTSSANSGFLSSNILMRNIYLGTFSLVFILYGFTRKAIWSSRTIKLILLTAVVMLSIAFGKYFFTRQLAYYVLPLMKSFRHAGIFRYFFTVFALLFISRSLQFWWVNGKEEKEKKTLSIILLSLLTLTVVIAVITYLVHSDTLQISNFTTVSGLKGIFQNGSLAQKFLMQVPLALFNIAALFIITKKFRKGLLVFVVVIDLFAYSLFQIPITVIGAKSFSEIENITRPNPKKFNAATSISIATLQEGTLDTNDIVGSTVMFEKKITRNNYYITPGNLKNQELFYESNIKDSIFQKPVLYLKNAPNPLSENRIKITRFSGNSLLAEVEIAETDSIIYLQNNYPGWHAFIDNKPVKINTSNISFMAIAVSPGSHSVQWKYAPKWIIISWYFSYALLSILVLYLLFVFYKAQSAKHQMARKSEEA